MGVQRVQTRSRCSTELRLGAIEHSYLIRVSISAIAAEVMLKHEATASH